MTRIVRCSLVFWLLLIINQGLASQMITNLSLKTDGRILCGTMLDFLKKEIRAQKIQISNQLQPYLLKTELYGIVLPPGPTGNSFYIGLLNFDNTLPLDFAVDKDDFEKLRQYAIDPKLAILSRTCSRALSLVSSYPQNKANLQQLNAELRSQLNKDGESSQLYRSFAGFILADAFSEKMSLPFDDLVLSYRAEMETQAKKELSTTSTYAIGRPGQIFTWAPTSTSLERLKNLPTLTASQLPSARFRPPAKPDSSYLFVWNGKDLNVIQEASGMPYDPQRFGTDPSNYLKALNPVLTDEARIPSVSFEQ